LLTACAAQLVALQLFVDSLTAQWDPLVATNMLEDWERLLALPDPCVQAVQTLQQRQQMALGRLTEVGGQSRAYFIDLARGYGEPGCTITEFQQATCNSDCNAALHVVLDIFFWEINIPRLLGDVHVATCNDSCNDALQSAAENFIECIFNATTTLRFTYLG
jgi:uncharacterized protein YmfQ (DUF2313 family)